MKYPQTTYIETSADSGVLSCTTLSEARKAMAETQFQINKIKITIMVLAYNRLEKTRRCVESILKNTGGIDYQLLLIDNGSSDGTLEYFENVIFEDKRIIRIEENKGPLLIFSVLSSLELGKYFIFLNNDVIVTPNWLKNMLICAESDETIGMVCAGSSNVSNFQEIPLKFQNNDEMMERSRNHNQSDPAKWEERLRLITIATLLKKEAILAIGLPVFDCGFYHDFGDDDLTFRVRRAGFKAVLAKDVWVHHDHDFRNMEDKDPIQFEKSIEMGKASFMEKWGVDAWDDASNYLNGLQDGLNPQNTELKRILGIDVKCGAPILDVKNKLRQFSCYNARLSAFTQEARYEVDLKTICEDIVACDREEFLRENFPENFYDYIVVGRPVNRYHEPQKLLNDVLALAKQGAQIILPLQNTFTFHEYLNIKGEREIFNSSFAYHIPLETMHRFVAASCNIDSVIPERFVLSEKDSTYLRTCMEDDQGNQSAEENFVRFTTKVFWFVVSKK